MVGNSTGTRAEIAALIGQSQGATGALQAAQAGNQLLALQAQQLADLTALVAAQGRAQALEAARVASGEEQAASSCSASSPRRRLPARLGADVPWPLSRGRGAASPHTSGRAMNGTGVIDRFLDVFTRYIDSGFGLLGGEVAFLAATLIVIDITLAALFWAWGADDDIIARLIKKTLFVGVFA